MTLAMQEYWAELNFREIWRKQPGRPVTERCLCSYWEISVKTEHPRDLAM